ncbi:MAG: class I SAM-dependent methyltransferase [Hyphomicrobiaceae bacterium]
MAKDVRTTASAWGVTSSAYEKFSEDFGDALFHCVQRLDPQKGEAILDIATGTGWTARLAAKRGANVTGIDFSEGLIVAAREIAYRQGLKIKFDVGDALSMPYAEGCFDAVISTFGVIFASPHETAASELARVCRPGGRIALAVWKTDNTLHDMMRDVFLKFSPPPPDPPPPSPYAWGNETRINELLGSEFDLKFEHATTVMRAPDGDAAWRLWNEAHGLTVTRMKALDESAQNEFREAFVQFHEHYRTEVGITIPRDYIIAIGVRR